MFFWGFFFQILSTTIKIPFSYTVFVELEKFRRQMSQNSSILHKESDKICFNVLTKQPELNVCLELYDMASADGEYVTWLKSPGKATLKCLLQISIVRIWSAVLSQRYVRCQCSLGPCFVLYSNTNWFCRSPDQTFNLPIICPGWLCCRQTPKCFTEFLSALHTKKTTTTKQTKNGITSILCCQTLSRRSGCASTGLSFCSVCDTPTEPPGAKTLSSFIRTPSPSLLLFADNMLTIKY